MHAHEIEQRLAPLFAEIDTQCKVTDHLLDKDRWRIYLTTMWSNLVIDPSSLGFAESDLEDAYEYIEEQAEERLGGNDALVDAFRFITTKDGERSMEKSKLRQRHKDMLLFFASMMLDPDKHREEIAKFREKDS